MFHGSLFVLDSDLAEALRKSNNSHVFRAERPSDMSVSAAMKRVVCLGGKYDSWSRCSRRVKYDEKYLACTSECRGDGANAMPDG